MILSRHIISGAAEADDSTPPSYWPHHRLYQQCLSPRDLDEESRRGADNTLARMRRRKRLRQKKTHFSTSRLRDKPRRQVNIDAAPTDFHY